MPMPTGVSDAAYLCQQQRIPVQDLRHGDASGQDHEQKSSNEEIHKSEESFGHSSHRYDVAEAINTLIQYGFSIGCDGELLPPRWLRVAR